MAKGDADGEIEGLFADPEEMDGFIVEEEMEFTDAEDQAQGRGGEEPKPRDAAKDTTPSEAEVPRFKCIPCSPTQEEIDLHDLTHLPYRNWCPVCVKAKAREDGHFRHKDGHDEEYGLPVISMDYELLEEKITLIVAKDEVSGSVLAYDCVCKGPTDEWVIKQIIKDLDTWGRRDVCIKTDGEPAIVAFQRELIRMREHRTVPMNPPAYDPQGNGAAEKAVQDVTGQVRCLKIALEARLRSGIDPKHPIVKWMIVHAAFLITRYGVGHDGMTAWRRLMKRKWNGALAEFGESVWAKLALKKSPTKKKTKRGKKKLEERSIDGVWLGIYPRTGEHIILKNNGDVVRVRTINRKPRESRFDAEKVMAILATPREPTPSSKRNSEEIPGELNVKENADDLEADKDMSGGANLEQAIPEEKVVIPREFRIDQRLLSKFGYSPGCPGCMHKQMGEVGHRGHTSACRERMYNLMKDDEDELDRVLKSDLRKKKEDKSDIPRASRSIDEMEVNQQADEKDQAKAKDDDEKMDEERRMHDDKRDNEVNEPNTAKSESLPMDKDCSDDEVPLGMFDATDTSEDDADEQPLEKRQRIQLVRRRPCVTTVGRSLCEDNGVPWTDSDNPRHNNSGSSLNMQPPSRGRQHGKCCGGQHGHFSKNYPSQPQLPKWQNGPRIASPDDPLKQQLGNLNTVTGTPNVRKILEELEKQPKLQLNARRRRTLKQNGYIKDVGEIYSPPRITAMASRMGLKSAWALDLTQEDPDDGKAWDFSCKDKREKAMKLLRRDKPLMLVVCPMCGPFSSLQNWNYTKMEESEVSDKLGEAMEHLKFSLEMCIEQHENGRRFLFEHPCGARSWETSMVQSVAALAGVHKATFDFCKLGMETVDRDGKKAAAKKRTTIMTNSQHIARVLREAQCDGSHTHQHLLDGRAGPCQEYPEKFCRLVCEGVKKEINDVKWTKRMCEELDITEAVETIMKATQKLEHLQEPPEEDLKFEKLYADAEFYDDVSGLLLDKSEAIKARRTEIGVFKEMGVYSKMKWEAWMKIIQTKWLDINKGDDENRVYRSRLVGCELKRGDKRDDLFAATPPLESLKAVVSFCASRQRRRNPHRIMAIDVKRAYFYAPATRAIYIRIPKEDWEPGDENNVGVLNLSLYGTRDAAMNWTATYTKFLNQCGFSTGSCSPCNFHHPHREMAITVHGDDFTCSGTEENLMWLEARMKAKFEIKCEILGPSLERHKQEIRILNRVLTWTADGIVYEPDQRHAEIVMRELGLEDAKPVSTPGCRDDMNKASDVKLEANIDGDEEEDETLLNQKQTTRYRAISARLNYLAQDRADIQYACKEAARRMSRPRDGDWNLLKRIGRYLVGAPRYQQTFYWQNECEVIDTFTDSDWAGCRSTCRSTSGGAVKIGFHCLKTWSATQATVALSSAEAELYALTKGAAQTLGIMSLMQDFGVTTKGWIHTDASAAIGIVQRQGLGRLRHLKVQYLWVQDKVRGGDLGIAKVLGTQNPADLMTKHLAAHDVRKHLDNLAATTSNNRARTAPQLNTTQQCNNQQCNNQQCNNEQCNNRNIRDHWINSGDNMARMHTSPRLELFTPLRVEGSPPVKALTPQRVTEGTFLDNGTSFRRVDAWTARGSAHLSLGRRWVGRTLFLKRSSGDLDFVTPLSAGQSSRGGVCAGAS